MGFDESIQIIWQQLDSGTVLVSDATMALLVILRGRTTSFAPTLSPTDVFFEEAIEALNKELLGYEKIEWNLNSGYRRCQIRTARSINDTINYIPNPIADAAFHMMWGSQQVEAFLSGVIDLSVLQSGDRELLGREIALLEESNPLFHSETGVEDIWAVFTGSELLRLYMQLKEAVIGVCEALHAQAISEIFVSAPQASTSNTVSL